MNNAFHLEEPEEVKPDQSSEETRLTRMIEAIAGVGESSEWKTLDELHFSKELERIERQLLTESKKDTVDDKEMYRLQGELKWAKRYADLSKWVLILKNQLNTIKKHE